jgi:KUP system potassium uptake protein
MAITSLLFAVVARARWNWSLAHIIPITAGFLAIDLTLFSANVIKIEYGGWVPIVIAIVVYTLMSTWKKGRLLLNHALNSGALPLDLFLSDVARRKPPRVAGTAVFMTSSNDGVPVVLLHHLKHNQVLHQQVVLLSVGVADVPDVELADTLQVEDLGHGFHRVTATYGFMQQPNVPQLMQLLNARGVRTRPMETSYYLGREQLIPTGPGKMAKWRKQLFIFLSRNARSATQFFSIPPNRVVELGTQIEF